MPNSADNVGIMVSKQLRGVIRRESEKRQVTAKAFIEAAVLNYINFLDKETRK